MDQSAWRNRLGELARQHGVPAASLAVLEDDRVTEVATGVLNVETGVESTPESVFQIGSVTKPYTAVLLMQLVDEGRVALDQKVAELLPELRLTDPEALEQVTVQHLLTHTSGIQGDHFQDTGRGDDALAGYVDSCATLGFSHPVGATMSYCNTGYVLAGRIVEKLTGLIWDDALRTRLLEPLGAQRTVTLPEEALRYRVAYGHRDDDGQQVLTKHWTLPRSMGPAGQICATAADVVGFARMHLDGGIGAGGKRVLSSDAVREMQRPAVVIPDRWTLGTHWSAGWILLDWDDRSVYGHDGNTIGQSTYLRVVPTAGVAVVLLTNGGRSGDLYHALFPELLEELCGLSMPEPLAPPDRPPTVDVDPYIGVYERVGVRIELEKQAGRLAGRVIATGPLAALDDDPVDEIRLTAVSESLFVTRDDDSHTWTPMVFYSLPDGASYLHMGMRATPRTG